MRRYISMILNLLLFSCELLMALPVISCGSEGLVQLRYFSVLSNLLIGIAALAYLVSLQAKLCGVTGRVPAFITVLKYASACAGALTLTFSCAYILPLHGIESAFGKSGLMLHMLMPLGALLDILFLEREGSLRKGHRAIGVLPAVIYCGSYLFNLIANGYGGEGHPNDWYRFGTESPIGVWGTLAALIIVSWLWAVIIQLARADKTTKVPEPDKTVPANKKARETKKKA